MPLAARASSFSQRRKGAKATFPSPLTGPLRLDGMAYLTALPQAVAARACKDIADFRFNAELTNPQHLCNHFFLCLNLNFNVEINIRSIFASSPARHLKTPEFRDGDGPPREDPRARGAVGGGLPSGSTPRRPAAKVRTPESPRAERLSSLDLQGKVPLVPGTPTP